MNPGLESAVRAQPELSYSGSLVIVALHNTFPGHELHVANEIDKSIRQEAEQHAAVAWARENQKPKPSTKPRDGDPGFDRFAETRHFALFGQFDLATVFRSTGFHVCNQLATSSSVTSQQFIIGNAPELPAGQPGSRTFCFNDPEQESSLTRTDLGPVVAICQIQVVGLFTSAGGMQLMQPALRAFDKRIVDECREREVPKCLFIDSFGWSDWTIVLAGHDFETILDSVFALRQTTVEDILRQIDDKDLRERLAERVAPANNCDEDAVRGALCTTYTLLGVDLEHVKSELHQEIRERHPDLHLPERSPSRSELSGEIRPQTKLSVRPGREAEVARILAETTGTKAPGIRFAVGKADISIRAEDLFPGTEAGAGVGAVEFLRRVYYLRWRLLGEPLPRNEFGERIPWGSPADFAATIPAIIDCHTEIERPEPPPPETPPRSSQGLLANDLAGLYQVDQLVGSQFWTAMRDRLVSKQLVDNLLAALSLWLDSLRDDYLIDEMIELADAMTVSHEFAERMLAPESDYTRLEIEKFFRLFSSNFARSFTHRWQASYHMCDSTDAMAEYRGGLTQFLTTVDGLVKALCSLAADSKSIAVLSNISHEATTQLHLSVCQGPDRNGFHSRVALAVVQFNWTFLVHPEHLRTLLHEFAHVAIESSSYLNGLGDETLRGLLIRGPTADTLTGYRNESLREIAVELVVLQLCFADDPGLYARCHLPRLALSAELQGGRPADNAVQIVGHFARSFLVSWIGASWDGPENCPPDDRIRDWWQEHKRYIPAQAAGDVSVEHFIDRLGDEFLKRVKSWWASDSEFYAKMRDATHALLSKDSLQGFQSRLADAMGTAKATIADSLAKGRPINVEDVVSIPRDDAVSERMDEAQRIAQRLRPYRLQALAGFLILMRVYFERLDHRVRTGGASSPYTERENGELTFARNAQEVMFDHRYGSVFVTGRDSLEQYARLRVALIKSMWHVSEVSKNHEVRIRIEERERSKQIAAAAES